MHVRKYNKTDYSTLVSWWKQYQDWEKSPVPEAILPPYGAVIEIDNKPICAGFLYETKGNGCSWMEWIVADPKADKTARDESLDKLIDTILNHAKAEGYNFVFTSVMHPKLIERLDKHGFMKGDANMQNMIRKVGI